MKNTDCIRKYVTWFVAGVFACCLFLIPMGYAEDSSGVLSRKGEIKNRLKNMSMLIKSLDNLTKEIGERQTDLQGQSGIGREQDLRMEIRALSIRKEEMEASFTQLATDVDTRKEQDDKKAGVDWQREIKELVGPLVREVKKITAHPREIERLRNQVETYEIQLPKIQKAIKNIDTLLSHAKEGQLVGKLKQNRHFWQNQFDEVKTRMNISRRQLDRKLGKRKTISESAKDFMQIFFKSRGRNLIISFLSFILTIGLFFYLHGRIQKISPIHKNERSIYTRLFDVFYYLLTIITAMLSVFAVLYVFGDWLLLSIAAIFLIGIGWASKQAIPMVWVQARLLLNLGPVREGELIVYRGLPFEVAALNLYTRLVNKALDGGEQKIPIKDLLDMRSRPIAKEESWFPSDCGDWVVLNDQTHGKVVVQTPEAVKLELLGGAVVTLKTEEFLSASPKNLSKGFRLWVTFGLDYAYIDKITETIPATFEKEINSGLNIKGFDDTIEQIAVHFKIAGPSSIDLEILADFNGTAGPNYEMLQRIIPGICVDICNKNHWVVPVNQVRVHMVK
jgi:hypothetical protein